jgi:transposase-like protein
VARVVMDQGVAVAKIVKDMGIGETAVRRWVEQYRAEQGFELRPSGYIALNYSTHNTAIKICSIKLNGKY